METNKPIEVKKKVVESAASELTKQVILLLLPLLSGLAVALVPQVRDRILPALPKPLLAVLVGISLSLNLALLFYVLRFRKQRNRALAEKGELQNIIDNPSRVFRFGVYWDKDLTPYCPSCLKPLTNYGNWQYGGWGFKCVSCKDTVRMHDDEGRVLELAEAKRLLSSKDPSIESRAIGSPPPDKTKLRQALGDLESIKKNLQNSDVEERIVILYHAVIERLKNETGFDLTLHAIPPSEINHHVTHHQRSPRIGSIAGTPAHTTYSKVRYCNRQRFHTAIDSAINRLKLELQNPESI